MGDCRVTQGYHPLVVLAGDVRNEAEVMAKFLECEQGSRKWMELRAGIPTSSEFDKIITPGGAPSKSASAYCNKLLVEVMLGRPLIGTSMPWMDRGKDMEHEAVKYFELMKDVETVPIGFVTTDDGRIGASPDRLVGARKLLEVKCPTDETQSKYLAAHIDALLGQDKGVAETYRVQCQGQLFVAERDSTYVLAYYPGLPEAITEVPRDEKFIALMRTELYKFVEMFDQRLARLKELGYLDGTVRQAAEQQKPAPEIGDLGVSDDDVERYIADLKKRGELKVEVA